MDFMLSKCCHKLKLKEIKQYKVNKPCSLASVLNGVQLYYSQIQMILLYLFVLWQSSCMQFKTAFALLLTDINDNIDFKQHT